MLKSAFSPSYPRNERTDRLAFRLATVLSLGLCLSIPLWGWAEGGHDLNITKDGGNVNVNLNTATSSDVSIRRSDDIMIIKVPKSYKGNIGIDPTLKKNSVVHEEETPSGRAITIQSQQIYLHTWDGEGNSPASQPASSHADKSDKQAERASGKASAEAKSVPESDKSSDSKDDSAPTRGGILKLSPNEGNVGVNNPAEMNGAQPVSQSDRAAYKLQKHHQRTATPTERGPLDITRLLEQDALFNKPVEPASVVRSERNARSHQPTFAHPEVSLETDDAQKAGKGHKPPKQDVLTENDLSTEKSDAENNASDPEQESLDNDSKQQAVAMQASINGLLRIFFSLLLVLGLVVGFIKGLLPKLLERYPDFFEKLKERKQWSTELPGQMSSSWLKSSFKPSSNPVSKPMQQKMTPDADIRSDYAETPKSPSKKNYLERLKMGGEHVQVLETTDLGKGKELHLVELKGKQFLVATTPYTVSLLKEVSEEVPPVTSMPEIAPEYAALQHRRIAQERAAIYPQPAESQSMRPAQSQPATPAEPVTPVQSQTIAYLSDKSPIQRVQPVKPYATQPGNPQRRKSIVPQFPAPPDEIYQPYASPVTQPASQNVRPYPSMFPNVSVEARDVSSTSPTAYIDAEEVVVLEDYEDVYGR